MKYIIMIFFAIFMIGSVISDGYTKDHELNLEKQDYKYIEIITNQGSFYGYAPSTVLDEFKSGTLKGKLELKDYALDSRNVIVDTEGTKVIKVIDPPVPTH